MANYRKCRRCCTNYLEAEFLVHRQAGYCTLECSIGEPRGIPTVEGLAWKDKIMVSALRERLPKAPPQELPPRIWKFDMVLYPLPKGWQIKNWRLEDDDKNFRVNQIDVMQGKARMLISME